jgi:hypothetical protein
VAYGTPLTTTLGSPNYPLNLLTPTPGDFDGDGDVDNSDLVDQWIPRFACGDLTGKDFLDWQSHLGTMPASSAGARTVPEPTSAAILILSLGAACRVLRRRGH